MPKKPDTGGSEDQAPAIDPQKKYLMDQFGSLMEKVGDGFGIPLQEELVRRLEQTIADFHEEVTELLESLKDNSEKRHEKLKEIWENQELIIEDEVEAEEGDGGGPSPEESGEELSDWEKRVEGMEEGKGDEKPADEGEKKKEKKGLFGRKKK